MSTIYLICNVFFTCPNLVTSSPALLEHAVWHRIFRWILKHFHQTWDIETTLPQWHLDGVGLTSRTGGTGPKSNVQILKRPLILARPSYFTGQADRTSDLM